MLHKSDGSKPAVLLRKRLTLKRLGAVAVLTAVMLVVLLGLVAFAIDMGVVCVARTELQRSADSAALAATAELLHQKARGGQYSEAIVRDAAVKFAKLNPVAQSGPDVGQAGEVVVGYCKDPMNNAGDLLFGETGRYNAVRVEVNRTDARNGEIPLFFGRVFDRSSSATQAIAQAAFVQDFRGFRIPEGPGNPPPTLMMLPFALKLDYWQQSQKGIGLDEFGWNTNLNKILIGPDKIPEIDMFPLDTGSGGNFGTVDFGSNNSNTPTLLRQIVNGLTRADLAFHGGQIALDDNGELILSADPGQKLGAIEPALLTIVGQQRIIPLYSTITGSGNGAQFKIVGFAGIRILAVQLCGSIRFLKIQASPIITRGGIPGQRGDSDSIYSPIKLVY